MKKIVVELNDKSINDAIKLLTDYKTVWRNELTDWLTIWLTKKGICNRLCGKNHIFPHWDN